MHVHSSIEKFKCIEKIGDEIFIEPYSQCESIKFQKKNRLAKKSEKHTEAISITIFFVQMEIISFVIRYGSKKAQRGENLKVTPLKSVIWKFSIQQSIGKISF